MERGLHRDDRHAIGVLTLEIAVLDGLLDLLEAVDRDMAVELAGDDDELAVRGDIDAVRTFGLGDQVKQTFGDRLLHRDEVHAL
jgi:hypothetical protein